MRAGSERLLARVVQVFGAAQSHHAYLFANAPRTSGLLMRAWACSLSLMGFAGRRLDRLHALLVPRPARAVPTTVLPVLPSLRDCLSNLRCDPLSMKFAWTGRLDYAAATAGV
ncbi:hypothetical protein LPA45_33540 (plasmid) [Cupriavidus sp. Agwp_2]